MAFVGVPVVALPSKSVVRITGVTLAASTSGIIQLAVANPAAGDVILPPSIQWGPYAGEDDGNDIIDLAESVEVSVMAAGTLVAAPLQVSVVKANGSSAEAFLITVTNDDAVNATPELEIYLRYH